MPSSWPTFVPYLSEFPHAIHVAVDVQSYAYGDRRAAINCLDDEPGDATPSQAGGWVVHEIHAHFRPCVYFSLSSKSAVQSSVNSSLAGAHLGGTHVFYWCADWTFYAHLDAGCDAVQWTDKYQGRNIDGSTVDSAFVNAKPPAPKIVCFKSGWQHSSLCLHVRAQAAALGQAVAKETGYLKVSNANENAIQVKLSPLTKQLGVIESRIGVEIKKHEWSSLSVSATNAAKLQVQIAPLEKQLTPIKARATLEANKIKTLETQLQAILHKYGYYR